MACSRRLVGKGGLGKGFGDLRHFLLLLNGLVDFLFCLLFLLNDDGALVEVDDVAVHGVQAEQLVELILAHGEEDVLLVLRELRIDVAAAGHAGDAHLLKQLALAVEAVENTAVHIVHIGTLVGKARYDHTALWQDGSQAVEGFGDGQSGTAAVLGGGAAIGHESHEDGDYGEGAPFPVSVLFQTIHHFAGFFFQILIHLDSVSSF